MLTKSGKKLHSSHLKSLKEKLAGHAKDLAYPINLSRGKKIDKNVDSDMRKVEILGKKIE